MARKLLSQPGHMHPDRIYWVVARARNTNDVIAGVRFINSISQIPLSATEIEKMKAVGFDGVVYEYQPGIKLEWNSQGQHTAFVDVADEVVPNEVNEMPDEVPKKRGRPKKIR